MAGSGKKRDARSDICAWAHNLHSPLEWTCLEEMATAVKVLVELAKIWGAAGAPIAYSAPVNCASSSCVGTPIGTNA